MAKTSIEKLLEGHLQDLILPVENPVIDYPLISALAVFLIAVFATLLWHWNKRKKAPREFAKHSLKKLHKASSCSSKTTALMLANILRRGFGVTHLKLFKPQQVEQINEWETFVKNIDAMCYSKSSHNVENADINTLLKQAKYWLNHS